MAANELPITEGVASLDVKQPTLAVTEMGGSTATSSVNESQSIVDLLRADKGIPRKLPLADPSSSSKPGPEYGDNLPPDEETKYNTLLNTVKDWSNVTCTDASKSGSIMDDERLYLTRDCLIRYLRADKWDIMAAAKRLYSTLVWRREYGVWDISEADSDAENQTGKLVICGFDNEARPCLYMCPGRQNTQPSPRQIRHLVFMLEHAVDLLPAGQETFALIIDFRPSKTRSNTAPGLAQGRETLNIMQTHYPSRLGQAFNINVHWLVNGFFKLITPFIDPLTRKKLHFNEGIRTYVPPEQLMKDQGGDLEFVYDHATYWPAMLALCKERRAAQRRRWENAGKHVGEREAYLKGADVPSIAEVLPKKAVDSLDVPKKDERKKSVEIHVPGEERTVLPATGSPARDETDVVAAPADSVPTVPEQKS